MAALDFPASPTVGQVFVGGNGVQYVWNGTIWLASSMASQASDTPPANPQTNQLWFNSTLGQLFIYYTDANSSQWVPANPTPSGVPVGGGIIREVTLASPAATIDLFSLGVRMCEIQCWLQPVTNSDQLIMRAAVGSTVNTGAVYSANRTYGGAGPTASADASGAATTVAWSGAITNTAGLGIHSKISLICMGAPTGLRGVVQSGYFSTSVNVVVSSNITGPTCDGVQLYFAGGNIAAGSFVRVIGWP